MDIIIIMNVLYRAPAVQTIDLSGSQRQRQRSSTAGILKRAIMIYPEINRINPVEA
jgi:hypothetical protein